MNETPAVAGSRDIVLNEIGCRTKPAGHAFRHTWVAQNGRNWIVMRGLSSVPAPGRFLSPRANSFGTAQENRTRRQSLQEVSTGELICDC